MRFTRKTKGEQHKRAQQLRRKLVTHPVNGDEMLLQGLTAADRGEFEAAIQIRTGRKSKTDSRLMRAALVVRCAIEEDGTHIFGEDDVGEIAQWSAEYMEPFFEAACELNGFTEADVERLEKNCATTPPASTPTASPNGSAG